ncbi:class I adenylate-forming enzyme family protein [Candidatus Omnitrophota bacterium]
MPRLKEKRSVYHCYITRHLRNKRPAVFCEGRSYSYSDLHRLTSKFVSFLQEKGIKAGDVVLWSAFDSIETIVAVLSSIRLGVVIGLVDVESSEAEWKEIIADCDPVRILATAGICERLNDSRVLRVTDDDSSEYFFSAIEKLEESNTVREVREDDPAFILFTSGTTGRPKGVVHSYRTLGVDGFCKTILKVREKDLILSCPRIHTSFGFQNTVLYVFQSGAGAVITRHIPDPFSLQNVLQLRPTLFFAVPSVYELLLEYVRSLREPFRSVRLLVSAGDTLYDDIVRRWRVTYKRPLLDSFGTTEACQTFISNIPGRERPGSVGKAVKGFAVRFDKRGLMCYKGPSLFLRYAARKHRQKRRLVKGWLQTEDFGYKDRQGYIFIKGRRSSIFKVNAKWVSAPDVEGRLRRCSLVRQAAVVKGRGGLSYLVSLNSGIDAESAQKRIRRYCSEHLRLHELPKQITIVERIPTTRGGKVNRRALEEL